MQAKLIVVGGSATKREVTLSLPATIGRSAQSDLRVDHATVSRRHCELFERDGVVFVRDSGSTNGTYVGNNRVSEAVVQPGDHLTIGPLVFEAAFVNSSGSTTDANSKATQGRSQPERPDFTENMAATLTLPEPKPPVTTELREVAPAGADGNTLGTAGLDDEPLAMLDQMDAEIDHLEFPLSIDDVAQTPAGHADNERPLSDDSDELLDLDGLDTQSPLKLANDEMSPLSPVDEPGHAAEVSGSDGKPAMSKPSSREAEEEAAELLDLAPLDELHELDLLADVEFVIDDSEPLASTPTKPALVRNKESAQSKTASKPVSRSTPPRAAAPAAARPDPAVAKKEEKLARDSADDDFDLFLQDLK